MACFSPLRAWRGGILPSGKRSIVFRRRDAALPASFDVPCGRCTGCRLERSRQAAMRCLDEAQLYKKNCFLTLTYADEFLPPGGPLVKRDFQLFMKRLRKKYGEGIRFYGCGEYGDEKRRPHYHILLFNHDFSDKIYHHKNESGDSLYTSESLSELWPFGNHYIGDVTFESAAYVARYVMKKYSNSRDQEDEDLHYLNKDTGEILPKEFVLMSRGSKKLGTGGIGRGWYEKFKSDVFPHDQKIVNGRKVLPPRYYFGLYELTDPEDYARIKEARKLRGALARGENMSYRLKAREEVLEAKIKLLKRKVE